MKVKAGSSYDEDDLQHMMCKLLDCLSMAIKMDFIVRDTHLRGFLFNPAAKPDFTLLSTSTVTWSYVVGFIELKDFLAKGGGRHEDAVGQLMDRTQNVFSQQPGRSFCLSFILGADALEAWFIARDGPIFRSNLLPLDAVDSPGALMLLRLLYSSATLHYGYQRPSALPSPFIPEGLQEVISDFNVLKPLTSPRASKVYSASLGTEEVVLKYNRDANHEVSRLAAAVPRGREVNRLVVPRRLKGGSRGKR